MIKSTPQRKCIACGQSKFKKELIRIVKNKKNVINIDVSGKLSGRGAYICNSIECLTNTQNKKRLEKEFEMVIELDIYNQLREVIGNSEK